MLPLKKSASSGGEAAMVLDDEQVRPRLRKQTPARGTGRMRQSRYLFARKPHPPAAW